MIRSLFVLPVLVLLAACAGTDRKDAVRPATDNGYDALNRRVLGLLADGYYPEAARLGRELATVALSSFGADDRRALEAQNTFGLALRKNGEFLPANDILVAADSNAVRICGKASPRTLERLVRDPWGSPYLLNENEGESPDFPCLPDAVVSAGQNGLFGDADDIVAAVPNAFCPKDKERP